MGKVSYKNYLETLNKISKAITSDLYLEDILKLIVIRKLSMNRRLPTKDIAEAIIAAHEIKKDKN